MANNLILTNTSSATIQSYGPLYIESGESFDNHDVTLRTFGTGNVVADLGDTGYLHLLGTDPSIVFDTRTATDTDFWMGIQEDATGTDDDKFMLGKGTILGTTSFLTIDSAGYVGIGTTSPTEKLHVSGNILSTGTISNLSLIHISEPTRPY